jgi:hypothetical protein
MPAANPAPLSDSECTIGWNKTSLCNQWRRRPCCIVRLRVHFFICKVLYMGVDR